mmetsp:Transcript_45893/g.103651  ORF Transcript_45893/g.103651 Transcript_45893/m.103651 type:complete len:99 (+) Transcript_45893:87-383(+)
MQNEAGDLVDLYIPRKCSWTNRLIQSKDKASVQLNVAEIDESGRFNGDVKTYAIAGYVRDHVRVQPNIMCAWLPLRVLLTSCSHLAFCSRSRTAHFGT